MDNKLKHMQILLCMTIFMSMFLYSSAQTCSKYKFTNQTFGSCNDLPYLNAYLYWNYNSSSSILEIAYRQTGVSSSDKWAAWAINPTSTGMSGSQALVAYQQSNGTMRAFTSSIDGYSTSMEEGDLSFDVSDLSATYENKQIIIFGTLDISSINGSSINQVWQEGPVSDDSPQSHATSGSNLKSLGILDLESGAVGSSSGDDKTKKKNIHGLLNVVSWGILMPIGALTARYLKVFKSGSPAWFYLHVGCQSLAYIIGVAGWGTGLKLGSESSGVQYDTHRNIGIILFILGTLQVLALLLRPKPDHKYRIYWNIYHHVVGFTVIILSITNIFKGFNILNPEKKWKNAYIGVIVLLALNAVWMECYRVYSVMHIKRTMSQANMTGPRQYEGV